MEISNTSPPNHSKIEFSDFFLSDVIFESFGFSFLKANTKKWKKIHFFISQVLGILIIVVGSMLNVIINGRNLDFLILAEDFGNMFMFGGIFIKSFPLKIIYRKRLLSVIQRLDNLFTKQNVDSQSLKKNFRMLWIFTLIENSTITILIAVFVLTPFIVEIYGLISGEDIMPEPVFHIYLPFNYLKHGYFEVFHIFIAWNVTISSLVVCCTDNLFATCAQIISMELYNLAKSLGEIDMRDEEEAIDKMKKIIKTHEEYLKIIKEVEEIFSIPHFANMFAIIGIFCIAVFLAMVRILI